MFLKQQFLALLANARNFQNQIMMQPRKVDAPNTFFQLVIYCLQFLGVLQKKCCTGRAGFDKVISVLKQQYSSRSLEIN